MLNTINFNGTAITPSKIVCIGRNYVDHIHELNNDVPDQMVVFIKPNSAISNELHCSKLEAVNYEGEISFLVKNQHFNAVGFGIDLTKRELQNSLKAKGMPWERAKAFDGAAVFSQFVEISEISDSLSLQLEINGNTVQNGSIPLMLHKPDQILRELQTFLTLNDGDIVMTGTPKGVGVISPGDRYTGKIIQHNDVITQASWTAS